MEQFSIRMQVVFMFVLLSVQVGAQGECANGNVTCSGVTNAVTTGNFTWCCLTPVGMVPNINYFSATNQTCTCITEAENQAQLQQKIINWSDNSTDWGRMCNDGDDGCSGSTSNSTVNHKFKFCCRSMASSSTHIAIFNGSDPQYIGCRCLGQTIPERPSGDDVYTVPPTGQFNSTGENCSYNIMCHDFPRLSCSDRMSQTTLCCYGSRGMQLLTVGETTRCTCTNELYKVECPANIKPIPGEEPGKVKECSKGSPCFTYEKGVVPQAVTEKNKAFYCCLDRNFTRHSITLINGSVSCFCKEDLSLDSKIIAWAQSTIKLGRMCTTGPENCTGAKSSGYMNFRRELTTCCWMQDFNSSVSIFSTTTVFDGDKAEFMGCRCVDWPLPTPDPQAYVVPSANTRYNSTGESCSYNDACNDHPSLWCQSPGVTFCCYGSRGMVTTNFKDQQRQYTGCTCTNEVYGEHCEAQPVQVINSVQPCQTACSTLNGTIDSCSSDAGDFNKRCCPTHMVAAARQSQCECRNRENQCGTSAAVRLVWSGILAFAVVSFVA